MVDNISLKGDKCVLNSALLAGIVWSQKNPRRFITNPISSMFEGLLYGGFCATGVKLLADNMNARSKYAFAGLLGVAALYHLYKGYRDDPPSNNSNVLLVTN